MAILADAGPEAVALDSATGVELHLPIAGPGARAWAFVIDWHVRVVLACAWYLLAALVYNRELSIAAPLDADGAWFGFVVAPPAAIYFLYHFVLEIAMRGRTPGKRIAGVTLVAQDGGAPGAGALATRNVFRLIDSFPLFYGVGLAATMLTRNRVRIGDLAAGTLLVYERPATPFLEHLSDAAFGQPLGPAELEVMNDLLRRWDELIPERRRELTRELLTRAGPAPGPSADDAALRGALERAARGASGR